MLNGTVDMACTARQLVPTYIEEGLLAEGSYRQVAETAPLPLGISVVVSAEVDENPRRQLTGHLPEALMADEELASLYGGAESYRISPDKSVYAPVLRIAREAGDDANQARYTAKARALRDRFNEDFWVDELGCYALGLDADKRPVAALLGIVTFGHQLGYNNILSMYAVVLLLVPGFLLVGSRYGLHGEPVLERRLFGDDLRFAREDTGESTGFLGHMKPPSARLGDHLQKRVIDPCA